MQVNGRKQKQRFLGMLAVMNYKQIFLVLKYNFCSLMWRQMEEPVKNMNQILVEFDKYI